MPELKKEDLKAAMKEVLEEARASFYVPPEQHFKDHEFIKWLRGLFGNIANVTTKTVVKTVVTAIIGFIVIGVLVALWIFSKKHFPGT